MIIKYIMDVMYNLSTLCAIFITSLYFTSSVYFVYRVPQKNVYTL